MVPKTWIIAALVAAVTLAGCTSGSDGGSGDGTSSTTTTGGGGVGGNVTVGNATANATASASYSMTGTNGTGNGTPDAPDSAEVSIEDDEFVNATVTIAAGGTVTWTHNGDNPHTVTADDGSFDSSPDCGSDIPLLPPAGCMENGETFSWTFMEPGTYTYHCKVHDGMTGTVVVQ